MKFNNGSSRGSLNELDPSEMALVKNILGYQLLTDRCLTEIRKNCICTLALDSSLSACPPEVSGRVLDVYPQEGGNEFHEPIEQLSMCIPRIDKQSSIVDIPASIIRNYPMPVSWYIRIPAWISVSDVAELEPFVEDFLARGIHLDVRTDVTEMQEMLHMDNVKVPWVIIVSSDWLSSQTPQTYRLALVLLEHMLVNCGRSIINFHPGPGPVLNDVSGYIAGRSTHFFLDAYRAPDMLRTIESELNAFLSAPLRARV